MIKTKSAAIACTVDELFQKFDSKSFSEACASYVNTDCDKSVSTSNKDSWEDCFTFLKKQLQDCPWMNKYHLLFELVMPDSQKRADVVLLSREAVVIFEFKMRKYESFTDANRDAIQANEYKQSIRFYHKETNLKCMEVKSYLTLTKAKGVGASGCSCGDDGYVSILSEDNFRAELKRLFKKGDWSPMSDSEAQRWANSEFYVRKDIAEATKDLFQSKDLPYIKSVSEDDIRDCLAKLEDVLKSGPEVKKLIFLTGVPGSGKTLIGLKTVFDHYRSEDQFSPVYITGNGPLANVLQNCLTEKNEEGKQLCSDGKLFIRTVKDYVGSSSGFTNNLIVFDEAQRAWCEHRGGSGKYKSSEPNEILERGDRFVESYGKNITIICLVGEGQEIHIHEERGPKLWAEALERHSGWNVYISKRLMNTLGSLSCAQTCDELDLDASIRTNFLNTAKWVDSLLAGCFEKAKNQYRTLYQYGFKVCVFRKKQQFKLIWDAHAGVDGTVRFLVSSHNVDRTIKKDPRSASIDALFKDCDRPSDVLYGLVDKAKGKGKHNYAYIPAYETYDWIKSKVPALNRIGSEFTVQGLEIDWPIIGMLGDYVIKDGKWEIAPSAYFDGRIEDKEQIIKNVYRVLLTRARKGLYIYVPEDPDLDETFDLLQHITQPKLDYVERVDAQTERFVEKR